MLRNTSVTVSSKGTYEVPPLDDPELAGLDVVIEAELEPRCLKHTEPDLVKDDRGRPVGGPGS